MNYIFLLLLAMLVLLESNFQDQAELFIPSFLFIVNIYHLYICSGFPFDIQYVFTSVHCYTGGFSVIVPYNPKMYFHHAYYTFFSSLTSLTAF
jgi:hypothetical protein